MSDLFTGALAGKKLHNLVLWGVHESGPTGDGEFATHPGILLDHIDGMARRAGCEVQTTGENRGVIFRDASTVAHWQITLVDAPVAAE